MDMYGISNAVMEANTLHGQIALNEEVAQSNYKTALDKFHKTIRDAKSTDSSANKKEIAEDLPDLNSVAQTGQGIYGGVKGAVSGGRAAELSFRNAATTARRNVAAQTAADTRVAMSEARSGARAVVSDAARTARVAANQAAEVDRDISLATGRRGVGGAIDEAVASVAQFGDEASNTLRTGAAAVSDTTLNIASRVADTTQDVASAAAEGTRYAGAVAAGAGRGFLAGAEEAGGIGLKAGGELTGLGGVVAKTLTKAGAGEDIAKFAGGKVGAIGGIVTAGQQIDSLIESGGKSMFTRVNAQGQRVAMSGTDKAGEILSEVGSVADVMAASSGGLFVPIAAALSLAGAVTSAIGEYKDEKTDDKEIGLKPDGTTDATKAPKLSAPIQTEAFTGLGFVGNMTHNPLDHIA